MMRNSIKEKKKENKKELRLTRMHLEKQNLKTPTTTRAAVSNESFL